MVLQKQNGSYYRVRVLKEETYRVKIGNALGLWSVSVCSSHSACAKQCTIHTANSAPHMHQAMLVIPPGTVYDLHKRFPLYASKHVQYMHFAAVQCLC